MFNLIDQLFKFIFKNKLVFKNEEEFDHKTPIIPVILFQRHLFSGAEKGAKDTSATQNFNQNVNAGVTFHVNETDTKSLKTKEVNRKIGYKRGKFKTGTKKSQSRGA